MRKAYIIGIGLACLVLSVAAVVLYKQEVRVLLEGVFLHTPSTVHVAVDWAAHDALEACAQSTSRPTCYDAEIPKVMDRGFSMEQAFAVTLRVQQLDKTYIYCHVLGHNLSAKETAKDPSKWTEVTGRCPTGVCANGCMHGAIQQKFRTDALPQTEITAMLPQLSVLCEPSESKTLTGLERSVCYHGLGHLGMYASGGDTHVALGICTSLARMAQARGIDSDLAPRCYEGTFMQVFQFLDAEDRALTERFSPKTAAAADTFCASFPRAEEAACRRESWPVRTSVVRDPKALEAFCGRSPGPREEQDCYNTLINIMAPMANYDASVITHFCEGLPKNRMGQCFAHAASRYIDSDQRQAPQAAALCAIAEKDGVGERCYKELLYYSVYSYHVGSPSFTAFCNVLPAPWNARCVQKEGASLSPNVLD